MDEIKQLYNLVEHCRHKRRNDVEPLLKAISALEKQIPKKVERIGCTQLRCRCGAIIRLSKYCRYCGQKLDWSDEE